MRHTSRQFLTWLLATIFAFCIASTGIADNIELPDIGDSAAGIISPLEEHRIGEAVMRNLRRTGSLIDDLLLNEYVNHVGYQLVSTAQSQAQNFHFFVVNDDDINAFALPGGYIGIHYGLLLATHSEDEFAAVLAHEIAHITQRHHARSYDALNNTNLPIVAALIAAMILGANDSEVGEAAFASIAAGAVQKQINFTRANEQEADRIGIGLLANAGFDPHSMPTFFELLARASRLYGSQPPEFLLTHPVSETRISDSRNRASHYPRQQPRKQRNYHLMKARLHVLTNDDKRSTRDDFKNNLTTGSYIDKDATSYGYALALLENGQTKTAGRIIKKLLLDMPNRIAYHLTLARQQNMAKQLQQAIKTYEEALALYPGNMPLTYYYAKTLIEAGYPKKAKQVLQKYLHTPQTEPTFYQLLSRAEAQVGNLVGAHEAMAKFYYQTGLTHSSITQLELGLKIKGINFYQVSRIEARLKELKYEIELLAKNELK